MVIRNTRGPGSVQVRVFGSLSATNSPSANRCYGGFLGWRTVAPVRRNGNGDQLAAQDGKSLHACRPLPMAGTSSENERCLFLLPGVFNVWIAFGNGSIARSTYRVF